MFKLNVLNNRRGDTMIEVLLATVILSIVLAGSYTLTNRATRLNQSAYERSRATNLVQQQAELLRDLSNDKTNPTWIAVLGLDKEAYYDCRLTNPALVNPDTTLYTGFSYLEPAGPNLLSSDISINGIYNTWFSVSNTTVANEFIDFNIYTCWEGLGSTGNQVSGTVLRLQL